MKKGFFSLIIFTVGIFVMGFPMAESEAAPKIVINAVTCWPVTHVGNTYYKEFIKGVNEKSKGEIEIKLLGGPEVVSVFDQLKGAASGVVDMIHGDPNYWSGIVSEGTIPQLAKYKFEVKAFRESGILEALTQAYLERGKVFFLGSTWIGMPFYIMTKKPVSKLEDIRGLKLRSMGGLSDVLLGEYGASVVKIASAETYEGLQRGIVDGALRNTVSLVEFKEYEVMKNIIFPPAYGSYGSVFIGERIWNKIPKEFQALIKEVMIEKEAEAYKFFHEMDRARLKEVEEKHGMKIVYLSDKDIVKLNETRAGDAIKDWIYKKAPKFGPPIYEKMIPYIK